MSEPGSRYVDFVVPGLLGMNLMGSGIWGLGFAIVDARRKKLLKRMIATPMSRTQFLASFVLSRLTMLIIEVGRPGGLRGPGLRRARARLAAVAARHLPALGARVRRPGPAAGLPHPDHRGRLRAHEPGDAADVDLLRGVLLVHPLSRRPSAVHPGPAAHRGERRPSGEHAGRGRAGAPRPRARRSSPRGWSRASCSRSGSSAGASPPAGAPAD